MNANRRLLAVAAVCAAGGLLLVPFSAYAGLFGPDNVSECFLSRMPGAANDTVALEIAGQCSREFPGNVPVKKQTGIFAAFHSGSECTQKKAKDTLSPLASRIIQGHCYALYEPVYPQFDPSLYTPPSR